MMNQRGTGPDDLFRQTVSSTSPRAALAFYLACAILSPAMVLGYGLWLATAYGRRSSGASRTAQGPLSARWLQHRLGTRRDEPANHLFMALPGVSSLAVQLVFGPIMFAHRLSGFVPPVFRYPFEGTVSLQNQAAARQTFYDTVVERSLPQFTQFVILGAGFDTRAYRVPAKARERVRSFEVDTPETMALKRAALRKAGIDMDGVTLIGADFEQDDWLVLLAAEGFDVQKRTLFLWEGVTPYLSQRAVEETLRKVAATARGSVIAFDYITNDVLESPAVYFRFVRASLRAGGEALKFGVDCTPPLAERLEELVGPCGLSATEQHTFGQETNGRRAWGGLATAIVI